jgi:ribosomal protein S2
MGYLNFIYGLNNLNFFLYKREKSHLNTIINKTNVILYRTESTFIKFPFKRFITPETEHLLTDEEREAGVKYKTYYILTKDVKNLGYRITKKLVRKKRRELYLKFVFDQISNRDKRKIIEIESEEDRKRKLEESLIKKSYFRTITGVNDALVVKEQFPRQKERALTAAKRKIEESKIKSEIRLKRSRVNDANDHPVFFTFNELIGQNAHVGHRINNLDPRSLNYLSGQRNGLYIINLLYTIRGLKSGLHTLVGTVSNRGRILFSNIDKRVYVSISEATKKFCLRYSLAPKKLPGILTNFHLTRKHFPGLARTAQIPAFALALTKYDHHIVTESDALKLPSIAIFDSNSNPFSHSSYMVPGNDESVMVQTFYLRLVFRAIRFGHQLFILKWLKKRGHFFDRFIKVFHNRIYKVSRHSYRFEPIRRAFYYSNFFSKKDLENEIFQNDNGIQLGEMEFLSNYSKTNSEEDKRFLDTKELAVSKFLLNYYSRRKLYLFLFKRIHAKAYSPVFHYNMFLMTNTFSEIFYPSGYLDKSSLVPSITLFNACLEKTDNNTNYVNMNQDSFLFQKWIGVSRSSRNQFLQKTLNQYKLSALDKLFFVKKFCFSNFYLFNSRLDRFGWLKRSKLAKFMVHRFLTYMGVRKKMKLEKLAQYKSILVSRYILKPALYMYRTKRMSNHLDIEMKLPNINIFKK